MRASITEVTRRTIIDYFLENNISWDGRLGEAEFLSRIYDLSVLPSNDHRYEDAHGDIALHRDYFGDWDADWVFTDSRFKLLEVADVEFLKFLCETIHPVVRAKEDEANRLLSFYNEKLCGD